jgi:hypothetical protein
MRIILLFFYFFSSCSLAQNIELAIKILIYSIDSSPKLEEITIHYIENEP